MMLLKALNLQAQEAESSWSLGVLGGGINYQGDLQPSSFSFARAGFAGKIWIRKSFNEHFSLRGNLAIGEFGASDKYNRDYLQARNLSFYTNLKETSLDLEFSLLDIDRTRFTPFAYGSIAAFRFNPYTYDANNKKVYLQPLSTEGQGLEDYPDRKPYKLTQLAIGFGGGIRYKLNDHFILQFEATQRKTFTDYLDDVSKTYVAQDRLLAARGHQAVELAFRGDELHNSQAYPQDGEQRGTPKEMDWYYYMGLGIEISFDAFSNIFSGTKNRSRNVYNSRCPVVN